MKSILVLGGYGSAGRAVVEKLVQQLDPTSDVQVVAAGRNLGKLERLAASVPGIATRQVDATDEDGLRTALSESDLVVNCVGPYIATGSVIAEAALRAGVSCFDLASEQQHYRNLDALNGRAQKQGILLLTGLGAYPGISGLMLSALLAEHPDASSAEMALVTGHPSDKHAGGAPIASALLELKFQHERLVGGTLSDVAPGAPRRVDFGPPFETVPVMEWPQLEVLALAKEGELQNLSCWVALDGQAPTPGALLRAAGLLPVTRSTRLLDFMVSAVKRRQRGPRSVTERAAIDWGAVRVVASGPFGSASSTASFEGLGSATAWLPAFAASEWVGGRLVGSGLRLPYQVMEAAAVLDSLRKEPALHSRESSQSPPASNPVRTNAAGRMQR